MTDVLYLWDYFSIQVFPSNPINDTTSYAREDVDSSSQLSGGGVLGRDGCIYAIMVVYELGVYDYQVVKIDTENSTYCFVGNINSGILMVGGILLQGTMYVSIGLPCVRGVC